jgi:hypothetical protein
MYGYLQFMGSRFVSADGIWHATAGITTTTAPSRRHANGTSAWDCIWAGPARN